MNKPQSPTPNSLETTPVDPSAYYRALTGHSERRRESVTPGLIPVGALSRAMDAVARRAARRMAEARRRLAA